MIWDFYLTTKSLGALVFILAGGISASRALPVSRSRAFLINSSAVAAGYLGSVLWYTIQNGEGWDGAGSVLYGWIFGGTAAIFFLTKLFKLPFIRYADAVAPWMLVAQFLNRLGCFDAGCCYGKPLSGDTLYPVQLYEGFYDLALLAFIKLKARRPGQATLYYFAGYAAARFFLEFLRGDNLPALWFMTVPQVTSVCVLTLVFFLKNKIVRLE